MRHNQPPAEVELDLLLTMDQRRTVTVETHQAFRESLNPKQDEDDIEDFVEELRQYEFEGKGARP